MNNSSVAEFTLIAKVLHWAVAGMIVLQFVLAKLAERAEESDSALRELALLANHKSVGITILALAIMRLIWRKKNAPPALPISVPSWQTTASQISHWSLYVLIIALPITGWLMSSASAYSVSWFNLVQLPDFVPPNPELKETFEAIHETLAKILFMIASVHILAAIKHAVIDKDGVLRRITSTASLGIFVAIIGVGIVTLGRAGTSTSNATPPSTSTETENPAEIARIESSLPAWDIDYSTSFIRFIGDQAGAAFVGEWQTFDAKLHFSTDALADSNFDVTIHTADVETEDDDRDATLAEPEWFDVSHFPEAYYRAALFREDGSSGFVATGHVTIKGITTPVNLKFTVEEIGNQRVLIGTTNLQRLELGIGTGEWEDTAWVSNDVIVNVHIEASIN